jgi:sodium-dependent dicarboxylate transporter 2/3/5
LDRLSRDSDPPPGLFIGLVGFAGVLAAPVIALAPLGLSRAAGLVLLVAGLAIHLTIRRKCPSWLAAVCLTASIAILLAPSLAPMAGPPLRTLAVTVLMATWWMTGAIPIPATSLLPLVLFPVLGIMTAGETAASYANNIIFLFMGGFILALGIQRCGLHRRIALHIVSRVGTNPERMVLGFMLATALLSMWISNTATALMMLPIGLAVITSMREVAGGKGMGGFAPALLLGIAYSASIGGLATPIGTPPNMSFLRILEILYPQAPTIPFGRWFLSFLPLVVIILPVAWLLLTRVVHRLGREAVGAGRELIRQELLGLGPMRRGERRMLGVFLATALLWITRADLEVGAMSIPGWAGLVETGLGLEYFSGYLHDATVAVGMALLLFLIPGDRDEKGRSHMLMDWETAVQLPWGILLLFGGGFALALALKESGLSLYLGEAFAGHVQGLQPILLVVAVCLLLTFLTEMTSNTATIEVMLPVLAGAAGVMGVNPLLVMIPATLSASCAFMLPIATPPNAIVFSSGELEMRDMIRAGLVLNLIGVALITLYFYFVASPLLGIDVGSVPTWALLSDMVPLGTQ